MRYKRCDLPPYPVTLDMWDALADEKRPIVVYGMGNGADKLIERFNKYNIKISDFFASDGFVRGHMFHGMRVKSFSEIKETYDDFVIVLSFASNRAEVLDMLEGIDSEYDMYVPDMPVAGTEYFDREFFNANYSQLLEAYNAFDDDDSRNAFASIINYKITGRMKYLMNAFSEKEELYAELNSKKVTSMIDAGAYNGDTVKEAVEHFPCLKRVIAIEPDPKNFKKLQKYVDTLTGLEVKALNSAVYKVAGEGEFISSGNRNSSISSTSSYEHKNTPVSLVSIDSINEYADYIKYDVEGGELDALIGSESTIENHHPTMLVSLYHRSGDIFNIVNYLHARFPFYRMKLRRLRCVPAWEVDLLLFDA